MCELIESICPKFGCHVALTGGVLYKSGEGLRKDCDILFYRIRQTPEIDMAGLWKGLKTIGLVPYKGFGWCYKATYGDKLVDIFFPEEQEGDQYDTEH